MKRVRNLFVHAPALCVALALAGCGSAPDPTAPGSTFSSPANPSNPSPKPSPAIVASYDLVQIGGRTLPVSYSGGGATWTVTGGHYYLLSDKTFAWGYEINGFPNTRPIGTTVWVDPTTVKFYQFPGSYPASAFYQERNGLFATGRIEGNTMTVTYEDFVDFEIEKYVLSN